MKATDRFMDTLWPDRHGKGKPWRGMIPETRERRDGYSIAQGRAVYHLDRMPLGQRLALAWLVLTWPWRD